MTEPEQLGATIGHEYSSDSNPPEIGAEATIRPGTVVYDDVRIGEGFTTGHNVLVREETEIGDGVVIGTNSVVDGHTMIGSNVSMQTNVYVPKHTTIHDSVFLGPGAMLTNDPSPVREDTELDGPTLESNVSVGANATVLPGVSVRERSFVAAGATVTDDVPPDTLAVGTPAETPRVTRQTYRRERPVIPIANPDLGEAEAESASEVIHSGMVADGEHVREFEASFADYCGVDHGVATSNGTTALHSALKALGIGHGDRVVTTPFSFVASANAIRLTGAKPVFADVDPATYNLDPDAVAEVVKRRDVDAILTVHLYGLPSDLGALRKIADEHGLALIEDCAQAHGATYDGQPVGSVGDVGCFSFYPTKNMTTGEGGMVVTDETDIAERARSYGNHGRPPDGGYQHVRLGNNFRMTNVAAAIGLEQLEKLPELLRARRANARRFDEGIDCDTVGLPSAPDGRRHAYHQYTVRSEKRDRLLEYLHEEGVGAKVYYPTCIHDQPAYDDGVYDYDCPVAERAADEVVSIPVHPELSESDVQTIIEVINLFGSKQ